MKDVCILQGSVATFFRCVGEAYNFIIKSSGFYVPKIVEIASFLTELFKMQKVVAFLQHG